MHTRPLGFTLIELLVVLSVIAILAAVSIPLLLKVKVAAHEASAISSLRTIHDSQELFRLACGRGKMFAASLPQLGAAEMISRDLSDATIVGKSGYLITLVTTPADDQLDTCTSAPTAPHWYASATPQLPGVSGQNGFATAAGEDIWKDTSGTPPPEPFRPSATISALEVRK